MVSQIFDNNTYYEEIIEKREEVKEIKGEGKEGGKGGRISLTW
jgi:hypothetical protein